MAAHAQTAIFPAQAGSGIGPRAHMVIAALYLVIVFMLFTMSSSVLWEFGLNHNGVTGSVASKIHPATYLTFLTVGFLFIARPNPAAFPVALVTRHPGALAFLAATLLLGAYIALDGRKGIATIFETYLLAAFIPIMVAELDERDIVRVEKLLHVLLAANAFLGLFEYLVNYRVFPFRFDGALFEWDTRSTALIGHPLENAQITGIYIMMLLAGGGANMPKLLRPAAILLQMAVLIPFGGRTALLLTLAMASLWLIPRALHFMRGGRASLLVYAAIATFLPLLLFAGAVFAMTGFFDIMADRFADDGGSAKTRLEMFEVFGKLSWHDVVVGASPEVIDSIRRSMGLEMGIENPVVRLILYQGAILTALLIAGFTLFMIEIARRLRPGYGMAMLFFVLIVNSYESIANKTIALAQFIVLLMAMFPRQQGAAR